MKRNIAGFTLVEVLSVMGVILILFGGVLSFFISNQKTVASGSKQIDLHSELRFSAERISRALRYAWGIRLFDENSWDLPSADTSLHSYIYFDPGTKTIMMLDDSGSYPLSEPIIAEMTLSARGSALLFSLRGERGTSVFTLDSSAKSLNFNSNITVPDSPVALRFSREEAGALATPENPEDEDDPPDSRVDDWTLSFPGTITFPTVTKGKSHTETKVLYISPSRTGTITQIDFSIARTLNGVLKKDISGLWKLSIDYGTKKVVRQEAIKKPIGREILGDTVTGLAILPDQEVRIELFVEYNGGNDKNNTLTPVFEFLKVEATIFNNP